MWCIILITKMKQETVKIRTRKGRIITLTISKKTLEHIYGTDKYGKETILPIGDIDLMLPIKEETENERNRNIKR